MTTRTRDALKRGCALALAALLAAGTARAGDRPFLRTASAAAEEDDDNVWSIETAWQRIGRLHAWSIAPEYAYSPTTSAQLELTRVRERGVGGASVLELEGKHLFNHIARDRWGIGLVASVEGVRADGGGWRAEAVALRVPFSWQIGAGAGLVHLNAGLVKPRAARREWETAAAIEVAITGRVVAFAEFGRGAEERLVHAGARWWVKRERIALDLGALRTRADGERHSGFVLGFAWYDL
jgi:hypothetical protein